MPRPRGSASASSSANAAASAGSRKLRQGLLQLLVSRKVIKKADLEAAVEKIDPDARGPVGERARERECQRGRQAVSQHGARSSAV